MMVHLIPEARKAWKMLSMRVAALAVVWGTMPLEWQQGILAYVGVAPADMPAVFGVAFIIARMIAQPKLKSSDE